MQYQVHVKTELGRDDSLVVAAESEREAVHAAYEQHDSVADVIDVHLVEEPEFNRASEAVARDLARGASESPAPIWFQDVNGNWPTDMPNVLGYTVIHHSLADAPLYTKAEADRIAGGLDGAVVCGITDDGSMTPVMPRAEVSKSELDETAEADRIGRELHEANKSEVDKTVEAGAKDRSAAGGREVSYPVTEYQAATYSPAEYRAASYTPATGDDTSRDPDSNISWGPDGDRRAWDETSRSWVTDPDWDGVRFDDDLAETSHAVARAREALAELNSRREDDDELSSNEEVAMRLEVNREVETEAITRGFTR